MAGTAFTPESSATIQGLWVGSSPAQLERLSMRSFAANGHRVHVYMYEPAQLPTGVTWCDAAEIVPRDRLFRAQGGYTAFADLFRYKLLHDKGGWWCDLDMICLRPLPRPERMLIASERCRVWGKQLCIGAMYARGGEAGLLGAYQASRAADDLEFAKNGMRLLKRHLPRKSYDIAPPRAFNPVNWWQSSRITAPGSARDLPQDSFALHAYRESWRWRLGDELNSGLRNRRFPADTMLGHLQQRYGVDEN